MPETAFGGLPVCRGALYGGDPDAGQYVQPGGPHPRRGQRHLQRRGRRRFQRDAHWETAAGQYPVEAMEYLVRTARTALE
ncbi:MAG: hypothetical protein ACLRRU_14805 [Faecalibacterium sp.]